MNFNEVGRTFFIFSSYQQNLMLSSSDFCFFAGKMGSFLRINRMEYVVVSQIYIFKKTSKTFVCGSFCHFLPNDFVVFAVFYKVFSTSNRNVHKLHINFSRRKKGIKFDLPKQTQFDQRHITVSMASFLFAFFSRLRHIIQVQSSEISAKSNSKQPIGKMRFLKNSNSTGILYYTQKKGMFTFNKK